MRRLSYQVDQSRRYERMSEMLLKYERGMHVNEIAAQYDMSRNTVMRHARNAGLLKRPKTKLTHESKNLLINDIGLISQKEIAEKYNVSEAYVSHEAKKLGKNAYRNRSHIKQGVVYESTRDGLNRFLKVS